jgi:hypothetical protein
LNSQEFVFGLTENCANLLDLHRILKKRQENPALFFAKIMDLQAVVAVVVWAVRARYHRSRHPGWSPANFHNCVLV